MRKAILAALSMILLAVSLAYASPQQSVAEAARKTREQKKNQPKAAKVFTNDDLAAVCSGVSVIGTPPAPAAEAEKPAEEQKKAPEAEGKEKEEQPEKDEAYWRKRFAEARGNLRTAEKELDILQRELNLSQQQYYSDPNKALREQYNHTDINNLRKALEDKRAEVEKLRQALSDLEDELRREGGNPGWARAS